MFSPKSMTKLEDLTGLFLIHSKQQVTCFPTGMTAKEAGKPGGGGGEGGCSPCCRNGGAPDLSPVLKSVKPLYGPERMRPMAGMGWYGMVWYGL
jgi:hypothetical protein